MALAVFTLIVTVGLGGCEGENATACRSPQLIRWRVVAAKNERRIVLSETYDPTSVGHNSDAVFVIPRTRERYS